MCPDFVAFPEIFQKFPEHVFTGHNHRYCCSFYDPVVQNGGCQDPIKRDCWLKMMSQIRQRAWFVSRSGEPIRAPAG